MWNELVDWKNKLGIGKWIIGCDFNSIKHPSEGVGINVRSNRVEMENFASFIYLMEVVDLPTLGNKFNWFGSVQKGKQNVGWIVFLCLKV